MDFRPLNPLFGAECLGFDPVAADISATREIERAMGVYGMLLIRNLQLDREGLARFGARFGALQYMGEKEGESPGVARLTNKGADGALLPSGDEARRQFEANLLWHVDSTYVTPGAAYSFLYAVEVPDSGGETEYCDLRVAWDALPPERRRELRPLNVDHSIFHSRALVGYDMAPYSRSQLPSITRKLVRRHRPSGRDALIVASHIERVDGLDYEAGRALVDELTAIAAAPDRVYRHCWRPGDLLIWDNRCIMHRARPFPEFAQPRDLLSCRTIDRDDDGLAATG